MIFVVLSTILFSALPSLVFGGSRRGDLSLETNKAAWAAKTSKDLYMFNPSETVSYSTTNYQVCHILTCLGGSMSDLV